MHTAAKMVILLVTVAACDSSDRGPRRVPLPPEARDLVSGCNQRLPDGLNWPAKNADDNDAMILALSLSSGWLPDKDTHARIGRDLAAIRAANSELASIHAGARIGSVGFSVTNAVAVSQDARARPATSQRSSRHATPSTHMVPTRARR